MTSPNADDERQPGADTSWLAQYYTTQKPDADAASDSAASALVKPSEKYELQDGIGAGGMKTVQRAFDRNAGRNVAMAQPKQAAVCVVSERRFLREARITAALEHPNIVPVHEIGVDETGNAY
ncbi:MAG: hypothetical protein ACREKL_11015, partial [Chthoniobacterales bacterium]